MEVPLKAIQERLIEVFSQKGMPQWIKVDNGPPLGTPNRKTTSVLALWLISLGIEVIWNRPRQPQDNAKVERSQGILKNWAEPQKCHSTEALQQRLEQAICCHNQYYPVSRLGQKTRIEAFPALLQHTGRIYNRQGAKLEHVLQFLAKGNWIRTVSKNGQATIFNHRFYVGAPYKHQQISIRIDPKENTWEIYDRTATLIKVLPTRISLENIQQLKLTCLNKNDDINP